MDNIFAHQSNLNRVAEEIWSNLSNDDQKAIRQGDITGAVIRAIEATDFTELELLIALQELAKHKT